MSDAAFLSIACCFLACYYGAIATEILACSCSCSCAPRRHSTVAPSPSPPSIQTMEDVLVPVQPPAEPKRAWVIVESADGSPMVAVAEGRVEA